MTIPYVHNDGKTGAPPDSPLYFTPEFQAIKWGAADAAANAALLADMKKNALATGGAWSDLFMVESLLEVQAHINGIGRAREALRDYNNNLSNWHLNGESTPEPQPSDLIKPLVDLWKVNHPNA